MKKGHEENMFYLGSLNAPLAVLRVKDIPEYLTEEFWSAYEIWNNTRLTGSLPISPVWGDNPKYLIDIITAFQHRYEFIVRG